MLLQIKKCISMDVIFYQNYEHMNVNTKPHVVTHALSDL